MSCLLEITDPTLKITSLIKIKEKTKLSESRVKSKIKALCYVLCCVELFFHTVGTFYFTIYIHSERLYRDAYLGYEQLADVFQCGIPYRVVHIFYHIIVTLTYSIRPMEMDACSAFMWRKFLNIMCHCSTRAAMKNVTLTAEYPYFFRKVIRNPNPMNIITWTFWNTVKK